MSPSRIGPPSVSLLLACCLAGVFPHSAWAAEEGEVNSYRSGSWYVAESGDFQICTLEGKDASLALLKRAETLRQDLRELWFADQTDLRWAPVCQIVLHDRLDQYVAAVGPGSERTVGSSLVDTVKGKITRRRIDLLGNKPEALSDALPHEMTHVVLADRFAGQPMPPWADEGVAILADSSAKQDRHRADLQRALSRQDAFRMVELMRLDTYPRPDRVGTFYGQSASLAKFLIDRKGHSAFLSFVEQADSSGCDEALRNCYEIENMTELERQWRRAAILSLASDRN